MRGRKKRRGIGEEEKEVREREERGKKRGKEERKERGRGEREERKERGKGEKRGKKREGKRGEGKRERGEEEGRICRLCVDLNLKHLCVHLALLRVRFCQHSFGCSSLPRPCSLR